jgi:HlyD family secretion protein
MRGKWLLASGIVVLLAVVAGFVSLARRGGRGQPSKPAGSQAQAVAGLGEITLQGKIQAKAIVNIPAPVEGIVDRMLVDVGDSVYEGQLLASIKDAKLDAADQTAQADADKAQARVADLESALIAARLEGSRSRADATRARSEFARAEKAYLRQQMLVREGATPRLVFEKAEKEYNSLKADSESLEQMAQKAEDRVSTLTKEVSTAKNIAQAKAQDADEAKAELAAGEVHSTVDGLVVGRRGRAGDPVDRSMPDLFQIATNLSFLEVLLTPDSKVLPNIKSGQQALVEIAEASGWISGTVREIKGGQVFVDFTSPSPAVKPGLTAQVKIKLS